ncbi:MAG: DUF6505 family protein [Rhodospirillales bacterium]
MKFAHTIQMDVSDRNVFENPAAPGEWAVTGTFEFADGDPSQWNNKQQLAFKSGWLGLSGFGRSTFVQVSVVPDGQVEEAVRALGAHLFERYGAPDMLTAVEAARQECQDMAALCDHPAGTLLAIERDFTDEGINERVRVIPPSGDGQHARIWGLAEEE